MRKYFPILDWLPNYSISTFKKDLPAGLTVGIMLVPQGMAYAMIAGLPAVFGLYAAFLPQVVYAIFGTSRQLAVGPVAMDSLLVASGLGALSITGIENYIAMAIFLAFAMGVIQLLLGLLRMGFLVKFLSKPVISGFTSAAAIIIGLSQLKHLLGIDIERSNQIQELLVNTSKVISGTHFATLAIGVGGILIILAMKKWLKKIPAALVLVVAGILVTFLFKLDGIGVNIVGEVPSGLPSFGLPSIDVDALSDLLPIAATLALIAFMEAISVAKAVEDKHNDYKIDPNQELIALGASNIVGSLLQSYPVTGGFSRTAVNDQAGAKTSMAAIISALVVLLTLLFLTPLFYYLPSALLASIIMVAVYGLIDFSYPKQLWKHQKSEFLLLLITFTITLTVGITQGIGAGLLLSMLLFIYRTSKPHIAELGFVKGTNLLRNVDRFVGSVELNKDVLILRFDAQLYYGNKDFFKEEILSRIAKQKPKVFILNARSLSYIDSTGMLELVNVIQEVQNKGIRFIVADAIGPIRDQLYQTGTILVLGKENLIVNCQKALAMLQGEEETSEEYLALANQHCVTKATVESGATA